MLSPLQVAALLPQLGTPGGHLGVSVSARRLGGDHDGVGLRLGRLELVLRPRPQLGDLGAVRLALRCGREVGLGWQWRPAPGRTASRLDRSGSDRIGAVGAAADHDRRHGHQRDQDDQANQDRELKSRHRRLSPSQSNAFAYAGGIRAGTEMSNRPRGSRQRQIKTEGTEKKSWSGRSIRAEGHGFRLHISRAVLDTLCSAGYGRRSCRSRIAGADTGPAPAVASRRTLFCRFTGAFWHTVVTSLSVRSAP